MTFVSQSLNNGRNWICRTLAPASLGFVRSIRSSPLSSFGALSFFAFRWCDRRDGRARARDSVSGEARQGGDGLVSEQRNPQSGFSAQ